MKKIDAIMNGTEQYSAFIEQLTNILEPFALLVKDCAPIYYGRQVEDVSMGLCKDCGSIIFEIDGEKVALVNIVSGEASVYGRDLIQLTNDDLQSVIAVTNALKAKGQESSDNSAYALPQELQEFMVDVLNDLRRDN